MATAIILMLVLGGLSCLSTTPESRAEAREKMARWNWLFQLIIVGEVAFMFWPRG
jgi:hypothetical protein